MFHREEELLGIRCDVLVLGFQMLILLPLVWSGFCSQQNRKVVTFYLVFHLNFESIFMSFISFLWDKMNLSADCESYLIFRILMRDLLVFPIRKNVCFTHIFLVREYRLFCWILSVFIRQMGGFYIFYIWFEAFFLSKRM